MLGSAETVGEAVPRLLGAIVETLGWDVAFFWSIEPDEPRAVWVRPGLQLDGFLAMTERLTLSPEMLPGRVAASGTSEWLEELEPARFARASVAAAEGLRSGVAFPVLIESEVIGVLETFSTARRPRDLELERTLTAIGAQLGQFVRRKRAEEERTQLLQRERQARATAEAAAATLRKLGRVSEAALEHLSLSDLLNALLERIVEVLQADTAAILLVGADGHLHVRATVGLEQEIVRAIPVPIGVGMAGRVAATRRPMLDPRPVEDRAREPGAAGAWHQLGRRDPAHRRGPRDRRRPRGLGGVRAVRRGGCAPARADRRPDRARDQPGFAVRGRAGRAAAAAVPGEASALLGASLDIERTLEQLGRLVAGRFADWCAIHLASEPTSCDSLASPMPIPSGGPPSRAPNSASPG